MYRVKIYSAGPEGHYSVWFPQETSEDQLITLAETLMLGVDIYKVQIEWNGRLFHEEV